MTSVLNVDTIADKAGTGPVGLTKQSAAKVYALFNASSGTSLTTSFGVSSLADNGTGQTTFTWTTAFSDGDWVGSCGGQDGRVLGGHPTSRTTTTGKFNSRVCTSNALSDDTYNAVSIFGDLA